MKRSHIGSERWRGGSPVKEEAIILSTMEYNILNMNIYVSCKQEKNITVYFPLRMLISTFYSSWDVWQWFIYTERSFSSRWMNIESKFLWGEYFITMWYSIFEKGCFSTLFHIELTLNLRWTQTYTSTRDLHEKIGLNNVSNRVLISSRRTQRITGIKNVFPLFYLEQ